MSSIRDAKAIPNAVKESPISIINIIAMVNPGTLLIFRPKNKEIMRIIVPWIRAAVAPPTVCPNIISVLETGATSVSFKKPNCLSQIICIPENIEVNNTLIEIIPGMINPIYPWRMPGRITTEFSPKPSTSKRKMGIPKLPIILLLERI
jgi:hypothetical protein